MAWGLSAYNRTGQIMVCFRDRFTAKQVSRYSGTGPTTNTKVCPHCRQPMVNMGKNFRPPRKSDNREWRRIETGMMLGLGYWTRLTPRQQHLVSEKRKRKTGMGLREGRPGRRMSPWLDCNYNPERM